MMIFYKGDAGGTYTTVPSNSAPMLNLAIQSTPSRILQHCSQCDLVVVSGHFAISPSL
jgi:hypothetical protein